MKKRFTMPPWIADKRSFSCGILIGAFAVTLLWFISVNTQISTLKIWNRDEAVEVDVKQP